MSDDNEKPLKLHSLVFVSLPDYLRRDLEVSSELYEKGVISTFREPNQRAYFLYDLLNLMEETGFMLESLHHTIRGVQIEELAADLQAAQGSNERRQSTNLVSHILRTLKLAERRLTEALVDALLFTQTNEEPYYRYYMAQRALAESRRIVSDFRSFYSCENKVMAGYVKWVASELAELVKTVDASSCWFAKGTDTSSSLYSRFRKALAIATRKEKVALRFSYNISYGDQSRHVHGGMTVRGRAPRLDDIQACQKFIELLGLSLLLRCIELTREPTKYEDAIDIANHLLAGARYSTEGNRPDLAMVIDTGDLVRTPKGFGIVVEVRQNEFGNRACCVLPVSADQIGPEEDWWPSLYLKQWKAREQLLERAGFMAKISTEELSEEDKLGLIAQHCRAYLEFLRLRSEEKSLEDEPDP